MRRAARAEPNNEVSCESGAKQRGELRERGAELNVAS
eukprot:CAMPEP_0197454740 /NCGR_PEP_ID=MMETSP1175-20131217/38769_1 /TAXON_ID=1003142 /ORGANISM="Triceratium dubium, Strain CCMP147" /LENGTH=36 /DNA_ID= /DNA_START= /DNA_END= /DNA_ORIENTATION=